jgi:hypothetical protein
MDDDGVADADEPMLTLDQAYRAAYQFIHEYYLREPIEPFMLMLVSMGPLTDSSSPRETSDPATWNDWMKSVRAAFASHQLPLA